MSFLIGLGLGWAAACALLKYRKHQRREAREAMVRAAREVEIEIDNYIELRPGPESPGDESWKDEHDDLYGGG